LASASWISSGSVGSKSTPLLCNNTNQVKFLVNRLQESRKKGILNHLVFCILFLKLKTNPASYSFFKFMGHPACTRENQLDFNPAQDFLQSIIANAV
jgi:hypothetical protein